MGGPRTSRSEPASDGDVGEGAAARVVQEGVEARLERGGQAAGGGGGGEARFAFGRGLVELGVSGMPPKRKSLVVDDGKASGSFCG